MASKTVRQTFNCTPTPRNLSIPRENLPQFFVRGRGQKSVYIGQSENSMYRTTCHLLSSKQRHIASTQFLQAARKRAVNVSLTKVS